jgi:hypothetical protein
MESCRIELEFQPSQLTRALNLGALRCPAVRAVAVSKNAQGQVRLDLPPAKPYLLFATSLPSPLPELQPAQRQPAQHR